MRLRLAKLCNRRNFGFYSIFFRFAACN